MLCHARAPALLPPNAHPHLPACALCAVDGGHRAVIWDRFQGGVQDAVVGEGTHFRIPFVTYPTMFDVRLRPRIVTSRTGTKDLQQVQISLRVLSRPDVEHLPAIYRTLGEDFDERVLPSIVNEVLKATVVRRCCCALRARVQCGAVQCSVSSQRARTLVRLHKRSETRAAVTPPQPSLPLRPSPSHLAL